jgi:hypothetical protein
VGHGIVAIKPPVAQVARNASANGSHVPTMLVNIARLCWIAPATMARSRSATRPVQSTAVGSGSRAPRAWK